jgi:GntR family transcriptional regulator
MSETFNTSVPIYQQIVGRLCRQIVRRDLKPGEKLPSVRDMAIQFGVNPNTIQRVYNELERMDVVETRRGQGTFVTENLERLSRLRSELMEEEIAQFVRHMEEMGFRKEEMLSGLLSYVERRQTPESN